MTGTCDNQELSRTRERRYALLLIVVSLPYVYTSVDLP
jgi:hypothetical protein